MKEEVKQITGYVRGEQQWICSECDSEISCSIGRCPTCGKMYSAGDKIISAGSNVRVVNKPSSVYNYTVDDIDRSTPKKEAGENVFAIVAIITVILFVIVIALAASFNAEDGAEPGCFEYETADVLYLPFDGDCTEYTEANENCLINISDL